jgi:hypothetical protein
MNVQNSFTKGTGWTRFVTLVCFFTLLLASLAGTVHKHASAQDTTCLICHASDESADTVAIASDAGKLNLAALGRLDPPTEYLWVSEAPSLTRSPRAPPQ